MAHQSLPQGVPVFDLSDDDEDDNPQICQQVATVIDLTGDDDASRLPQRFPIRLPVHNFPSPLRRLDSIQHNDLNIHIRDYVEVSDIADSCNAQFLKVTAIIVSPEAGYVLHGVPFTRARRLNGQLPRTLNEVCMIIDSTRDDPRTEDEQAMIHVPLEHVINKRDLECTNASFPAYRYRKPAGLNTQNAEVSGRLICRWKYKRIWATSQARRTGLSPAEYVLLHMGPGDVTIGSRYRRSEMERFNTWRAGNNPPNRDRWDVQPRGRHDNSYSFGDFFAGAGGASCGARRSHLDVQVACEIDEIACLTYEENLTETQMYAMDVHEFITNPKNYQGHQLDVIHLSPPCQPYSPAHTIAGKNDESNEAALFVCQDVVNVERPRVITVEETFGILSHEKHVHFFNALVRGFTSLGYSLRWKIVDLRNWGVPMKRRRLVMIGSCPGEPLPDFPVNTHSEHSRPRPWRTVATALARIPNHIRDDMHSIGRDLKLDPPRSPWDPNMALRRTIVTKGAHDHHPSGTRKFTLRELATLCGFPVRYKFFGNATQKKRQIGNCFPACAAKVLFTHVRKCMEQTDRDRSRRVDAALQMAQQAIVIDDSGSEDDVIVLSDDDDNGDQDLIIVDDADDATIVGDDDGDQDAMLIDEDDGDQDVVCVGVRSCRPQ